MELSSCPFCGCDDVEIIDMSNDGRYSNDVDIHPKDFMISCPRCPACMTQSPDGYSLSGVVLAWNRRG